MVLPGLILVLLLALILFLVLRAIQIKKPRADWHIKPDPQKEDLLARKLSDMVRHETISVKGVEEPDKFRAFHKTLERLFPSVFSRCKVIDLDGSLLIEWKGKSDDKPILLLSHMDVVEAGPDWSQEPFGGKIENGKVWGRGTADTKASLMAFLQAAEELLETGYVPAHTVYLASSCSEETAGPGAERIVDWLQAHGVHLAMVIDEGGAILEDPLSGVEGKFAMVGLFEKGQGNLKFIARSNGGHASMPPKHTPVARLADFVSDVDRKTPMDIKMPEEVQGMFEELAPYASFPLRLVLGNLWLFKPVLQKVLPSISPQAAAMLQTTVAFTMMEGAQGPNVIPQEAYVIANLRFIPHQKVEESVKVLTDMAAKYNLEVEVLDAQDPSPRLDRKSGAFASVSNAIESTFGALPVIPYVVTGATDARHFHAVSDACVRFVPVVFGKEQMSGMHGKDECIETVGLPFAVDFYKNIITAL